MAYSYYRGCDRSGYYGRHAYEDGFNRGCETSALAALQIGLGGKYDSYNNCDDDCRRDRNDSRRRDRDDDDDIIIFNNNNNNNGYENMNVYRNPNYRGYPTQPFAPYNGRKDGSYYGYY